MSEKNTIIFSIKSLPIILKFNEYSSNSTLNSKTLTNSLIKTTKISSIICRILDNTNEFFINTNEY